MECGMPIIAATDKNTDLAHILEVGKFGLWSESGNLTNFYKNIDMICKNKQLANEMGNNGRQYLDKNYTSDIAYDIIMKHFK
jgi:glycosyltransferase involved in cell wall biosynthesis